MPDNKNSYKSRAKNFVKAQRKAASKKGCRLVRSRKAIKVDNSNFVSPPISKLNGDGANTNDNNNKDDDNDDD